MAMSIVYLINWWHAVFDQILTCKIDSKFLLKAPLELVFVPMKPLGLMFVLDVFLQPKSFWNLSSVEFTLVGCFIRLPHGDAILKGANEPPETRCLFICMFDSDYGPWNPVNVHGMFEYVYIYIYKHTHRIHGTGIYLHLVDLDGKCSSIYTSPMDPTGFISELYPLKPATGYTAFSSS